MTAPNRVAHVAILILLISANVFAQKLTPHHISLANGKSFDLNLPELKFFDFGGWHLGTDAEMLSINDFKRGFGGKVVREYQCERILTLKGWIILNAAKMLEHGRALPSNESEPVLNAEFPVRASVAIK